MLLVLDAMLLVVVIKEVALEGMDAQHYIA